jgi:DNA primase small subunit
MTMALKCVDCALRDDFGFKHILWIYSGRRGVHCWVNDSDARKLSNEARSAVVEYLSLEVEGKESIIKDKLMPRSGIMHPHLRRSYDILEPYFRNAICDDNGQALLTTKKSYRPILNEMPDGEAKFRAAVDAAWAPMELTGKERWDILCKMINELKADSANAGTKKRRYNVPYKEIIAWKTELVFKYTYPRLDANVSKAMNHLLKSPFCVHPKTGRVCIPIDPSLADEFNPFSCPTVRTLADEINEFDKKNPDQASTTFEFEKTSLKDALTVFNKSYWKSMETDIKLEFKEMQDNRSAMTVDF